MASEEEKQSYLRENIIEKGHDADKFIAFLESQRENGSQVESWELEELKNLVSEFLGEDQNSQKSKEDQNSQKSEEEENSQKSEDEGETPVPVKPESGSSNSSKSEKNEEKVDNESSSSSSSSDEEEEAEKKEGKMVEKGEEEQSDDDDIGLMDENDSLGEDGKKIVEEDEKKSSKYYSKRDVNLYAKTILVTDEPLTVEVSNPEVVKGKGLKGKYTVYTIKCDTFAWLVKRRYSDFDWLYRCLIKRFPANYVSFGSLMFKGALSPSEGYEEEKL